MGMTHESDQKLLSLIGRQKAEFNHISKLRTWILRVQTCIGAIAAIALPINNDKALYLLAVVGLCLSGLWLYLWKELGDARALAERLRRRTMLVGGLGLDLSGSELMELAMEGRASNEEAERLVDPNYFASARPAGVDRFVDMLEESAIWTTNLARIASREAWLLFGGMSAAVLIALLGTAVVATPSEWQLGARILTVMLATLASADFLGSAMSYSTARSEARRIVDQLQRHKGKGSSLEDIMVIFCDYNSAVETMPPFSSGLYPRNQKVLNERYRMFLTGPQ